MTGERSLHLQATSSPPIPAQLRSHPFPVTAVSVHPSNLSLISGDEGGWAIWWSLSHRRPLAIFRPHEKSIVTLQWLSHDRLLTHGRDNKLKVFEMGDLSTYNTKLPSQLDSAEQYRAPWMVHFLDVNSLSFCNVSACGTRLATPSTMDSEKIDVFELGDQLSRPFKAVAAPACLDPIEPLKTGILMALLLANDGNRLVAGYESGHIMVFDLKVAFAPRLAYFNKCHNHPVLSLSLDRSNNTYLSCAADSLVARHDLTEPKLLHVVNTKHSGLNSISVRSDGKVFATAGWDGMVRVFSRAMKPLAVLKGGEGGVSCVDFGPVLVSNAMTTAGTTDTTAYIADKTDTRADTSILKVIKSSLSSRQIRTSATHHLAVGGKNGRVLLYNIY